jgi:hypothetical protein
VYYVDKIPFLLLLVFQVSAIEGQRAPMLAGIGGVPSPLDHQAPSLVIALTFT